MALARVGDTAGVEKLAQQLDREVPLGTIMQSYTLPSNAPLIELSRKHPERAIELLTLRHTNWRRGLLRHSNPSMYKGLAYLKLGMVATPLLNFKS